MNKKKMPVTVMTVEQQQRRIGRIFYFLFLDASSHAWLAPLFTATVCYCNLLQEK